MNKPCNRNIFWGFILLLFVACQDGRGPVQPDPLESGLVEPVEFTLPEVLFTDAARVVNIKHSTVIMDQLIKLIEVVPENGSIYLSIYLFEYELLIRALEKAHTKNVKLHVMMDMSNRSNNTATASRLFSLEENVEIIQISNNVTSSAINHNKFVLLPEIVTEDGPE